MKKAPVSYSELPEQLGLLADAMAAVAESLDRFAEESWDHPEAARFFEDCLAGLTFLDAFVEARLLCATPLSPVETEGACDSFKSESGSLRAAALKARLTFCDELLSSSLSVLADTLDDLKRCLERRNLPPVFNRISSHTAQVA